MSICVCQSQVLLTHWDEPTIRGRCAGCSAFNELLYFIDNPSAVRCPLCGCDMMLRVEQQQLSVMGNFSDEHGGLHVAVRDSQIESLIGNLAL